MRIDTYLYGYLCMHIFHRDHLFIRIQIIYDMLDVKLEERGESFYNPFLSQVVADLTSAELLEESEGAQVFVVCNKKDDKKLPVDRLRYRYLRRARVPSSVLCIPVSMSLNAHTHAHTHTHTHTHTQKCSGGVCGRVHEQGRRQDAAARAEERRRFHVLHHRPCRHPSARQRRGVCVFASASE